MLIPLEYSELSVLNGTDVMYSSGSRLYENKCPAVYLPSTRTAP